MAPNSLVFVTGPAWGISNAGGYIGLKSVLAEMLVTK